MAIITLHCGQSVAQCKTAMPKTKLPGEHGFLGLWGQAPLPAACGCMRAPATLLVGPDGKLLARDLHGEAIPRSIELATGGQQNSQKKVTD